MKKCDFCCCEDESVRFVLAVNGKICNSCAKGLLGLVDKSPLGMQRLHEEFMSRFFQKMKNSVA